MGFPPQIIHLAIGFSIIFTIHFWGFPHYFWKRPYRSFQKIGVGKPPKWMVFIQWKNLYFVGWYFFPTSTWQLRKRSVTSSRHHLLEALHPYSMAMKHDGTNRCLGMKDVKDVKAVKAVWCIWLKGGFSMMYHDFIAVSSGFQYVCLCFQGLNCFFWCLLMFVATLEVAIQVLVSLKTSHLWKSDVNPSCKFVCRTTNGRVYVSLPASWLFKNWGKKTWWTFFGKIPPMTGNFRGLRTVYISKESSEIDGCQSEDFHPNFWKIRKDTIRAIRYPKIPTFHRILPTFLGVFPQVHEILFEAKATTWSCKGSNLSLVAWSMVMWPRAGWGPNKNSRLNSARQFIATSTEVTPEGSWVRVFSYHCGCKFNTAHRTSESAYEVWPQRSFAQFSKGILPKMEQLQGGVPLPKEKRSNSG